MARSRLLDPRTGARTLGLLLATAGGLALLTLLLPHGDLVRDVPLLVVAPTTVIGGLIVSSLDPSRTLLAVLVFTATLLLLAGTVVVGGSALFPVTLTWTALFAFTFLDRRLAFAHTAFLGAGYAVVVALESPTSPVTRWILVVGSPIVAGVVIARLLQRLGEEVARTGAIVEAAADAFMTVDGTSEVRSWNRAAEVMFGVERTDAIGRDAYYIVFGSDPAQRPEHERRRDALLARPEGSPAEHYDIVLQRADGSRFPAEVSAAAVHGGDEVLVGVFIRDRSERVAREQARRDLVREQAAREEAERINAIVQGLQRLLDAALAFRDLDGMLASLLPRLCEVVSATDAVILLAEADGQLVVHASTGDQPVGAAAASTDGEGIAGRVARSGEAVLAQDPSDSEAVVEALTGASSLLTVPLMAGGQATGVIQLAVTGERRFAEDDLTLLGLAADRVALAIDHARVYEREHRIAETLQRSLLPGSLPRVPGIDVAARYLPAAAEAEVGGDWYDVIQVDSGRVALVMGDVAGKGLAAASMVGRLRSALRAYAVEGHEAAEVVERLNQMLWSELGDSEMATLVYLVLDVAEGTLSWVNAGHLPPLVREGGEAQLLEGARSVPLGVMPFPGYEQETVPIRAGTSVLLYTDGLVERPGEALDDRLESLRATVSSLATEPEALCSGVLESLVPGGAAADDVALLALHLPGLGPSFELVLPAEAGELAPLRALLRRWLADAGADERDGAEILAAAGEAASNAIEHGPSGGVFTVAGDVTDPASILIAVRDSGDWDGDETSDGRGLLMMRALMDSVAITRGASGTLIEMHRRLHT